LPTWYRSTSLLALFDANITTGPIVRHALFEIVHSTVALPTSLAYGSIHGVFIEWTFAKGSITATFWWLLINIRT
jgi:hypothetical protein